MQGNSRHLSDGEILFTENEPSDFACIIRSGAIEVYTTVDGSDVFIAELGPKELLGEMGVIDGHPRSASARARGPTVIQEFEAKDFLDQVSRDPAFAAQIMAVLVSRLRRATGSSAEAIAINMPDMPEGNEAPPSAHELASEGPQRSDLSMSPKTAPSPTIGSDMPSSETDVGKQARAERPPAEAREEESPEEETPEEEALPEGPLCLLMSGGEATEKLDAAVEALIGDGLGCALHRFPLPEAAEGQEPDPVPTARAALANSGARLAIVPTPISGGTGHDWVQFQIITPWPDEEAKVGGYSVHDRVVSPLPCDVAQQDAVLALLAAAVPGSVPGLLERLRRGLPGQARSIVGFQSDSLSPGLVSRQRMAIGNAQARLASLDGEIVHLERAVQTYREALQIAPPEDDVARGMALLHLAIALAALADKRNESGLRNEAITVLAEAAGRFGAESHPFQYITAHARHGALLYRKALSTQDLDTCKAALEAFNRALGICDKSVMQGPWADTMNGLGQVLILMGRLSRNIEFVVWASQVCRNAMEVRTKDHNPLGWARTLNNRATALYLAGRGQAEPAFLAEAIRSFVEAREVFEQYRITPLAETASRNEGLAQLALNTVQMDPDAADPRWWMA